MSTFLCLLLHGYVVKLGSLGFVYAIRDSFSCRHGKLSCIVGTPVYTGLKGVTETYPICEGTLSRSRRRGITTLQKARRNHCSHVSTEKPIYIREGFRTGARALQYSVDIKP